MFFDVMIFHGILWFLWYCHGFSWFFMVYSCRRFSWFLQFFWGLLTIMSHFFLMVANYWSSDAVFAEGLNNKEDVNDKVNKRVDGKITDPFKEVLNLHWGISSIFFPREGTNEDEWEEGRKDKQTYLEISTQIKCASVVNSCTTLSIQRLRRIKLYFLLFNLLSSSTFCRISYWELWQIRLPERRSESGPGSSFWRSRIFFFATLQLYTLSLLY